MHKFVLIVIAAALTCGNFAYIGATSAQATGVTAPVMR